VDGGRQDSNLVPKPYTELYIKLKPSNIFASGAFNNIAVKILNE
jgi:hypothetical protein